MRSSTAEKNALISAVDQMYESMGVADRRRFLTVATEELLSEKPELQVLLEKYFARVGWKLQGGALVPVDVFDVGELAELPEGAHTDLMKAAVRLRDGDLSGAISAACGAVDSVTSELYSEHGLGNPTDDSFQKRIVRSLDALGVYEALEGELRALRWDAGEASVLAKNVKGAINQGAFVLQKLRSGMGDVHGTHPPIKAIVFDTLKWAALTVRLMKRST
jgi:hypothetical protein